MMKAMLVICKPRNVKYIQLRVKLETNNKTKQKTVFVAEKGIEKKKGYRKR